MQKKVQEFFESHPDTDVVFGALSKLFVELETANAFCGGTAAKPETFTRAQFVESEEIKSEVVKEETAMIEGLTGSTLVVDENTPLEVVNVNDAVAEEIATPAAEETPAPEVVEETPAPADKPKRKQAGKE